MWFLKYLRLNDEVLSSSLENRWPEVGFVIRSVEKVQLQVITDSILKKELQFSYHINIWPYDTRN